MQELPRNQRVVQRDELFKRVWDTPMARLAREFGLSDVGLAKICKRMGIPRPPRGYWARLEAGKVTQKPMLGKLPEGCVDHAVIRPSPESVYPVQKVEVEKIPVPSGLNDPHRLTSKSMASFEKGKPDEKGVVLPRNKYSYDIRVTRESLDRAHLVMDTLVKALEERGYPVKLTGEHKGRSVVTVDDESFQFGITEKIRRSTHKLMPEERAKTVRYYWEIPRYDYHPTGQLALRIFNAFYGVRQQWSDGKIQKIETCLGEFIEGLRIAAEREKERRAENERRRIAWQEEERRRAEIRRLEDIEKRKADKLLKDVDGWATARRIRAYITELESKHSDVEGVPEWIEWARAYADKIDPIQHEDTLLLLPAPGWPFDRC